MIKASTIAGQLQAILPTQTSLFTDADISISSLTRSGTTVTAVTSSEHGLATGNYANIVEAKNSITISSMTSVADSEDVGAIVTVTLASDHDLTEGFDYTVEIAGSDQSAYNGTFTLLTVPNRKSFTYAITTQPASPATGTILYLDTNGLGYNGRYPVIVSDTTTFTYETAYTPDSPAQGVSVLKKGIRVARAISWEKATEAYTSQSSDDLWAFVVLGDISISKDRRDSTDAIQTLSYGDEYRQRLICPFSIFIYVPCSNEIAGGAARDTIEDVRVALYKAILRSRFTPVLSQAANYVTVATGDRFAAYNSAFYIHEFMFETVCDITLADTVDATENRAFRDFSLIFKDPDTTDGDDIIMQTSDIDLDDTPV